MLTPVAGLRLHRCTVTLVSGHTSQTPGFSKDASPRVVPGTELQHGIFWITFRGGRIAARHVIIGVRFCSLNPTGLDELSGIVLQEGLEHSPQRTT